MCKKQVRLLKLKNGNENEAENRASRYKINRPRRRHGHKYTLFISNTSISTVRLKLAKNQVNAKQRSEAEPLLFENYSNSPSTLSSKNNREYSEK